MSRPLWPWLLGAASILTAGDLLVSGRVAAALLVNGAQLLLAADRLAVSGDGGARRTRAQDLLHQALAIAPNYQPGLRAKSHLALTNGDTAAAASALESLAPRAAEDFLLALDFLDLCRRGGSCQAVSTLFGASFHRLLPKRLTSEADLRLLASYGSLERARAAPLGERRELLLESLNLNPADLSVNYELLRWARAVGDAEAERTALSALQSPSAAAVAPASERARAAAVEVIPALVQDGVWDRDLLDRAVRYAVWRSPGSAATARVVDALVAEGFGMSVREELELRKAGVTPPRRPLDHECRVSTSLLAATPDRAVLAPVLGRRSEGPFGPNLIADGDFDVWHSGDPQSWYFSEMTDPPLRNRAAIVGGPDCLIAWEGCAARVDALWVEDRHDRERARAGFWLVRPAPHTTGAHLRPSSAAYIFALSYRTENVAAGGVAIWLSNELPAPLAGDVALPPTNGEWQRVFLFTGVLRSFVEIRPLLRLRAPGRVWFDSVSLRHVENPPSPEPPAFVITTACGPEG